MSIVTKNLQGPPSTLSYVYIFKEYLKAIIVCAKKRKEKKGSNSLRKLQALRLFLKD